MSAKFEYIYWDACVFSSYHGAIPDRAPILDAILAEVEKDRNRRIVTSSISILEVAFADGHGPARPITAEHAEKIDAFWRSPHIELVDIHQYLLIQARQLLRQAVDNKFTKLSPNDALHLATATWINQHIGAVCEIQTYDTYWINHIHNLIEIKICEPHAHQPRLLA